MIAAAHTRFGESPKGPFGILSAAFHTQGLTVWNHAGDVPCGYVVSPE
jgi:hypothetical protein